MSQNSRDQGFSYYPEGPTTCGSGSGTLAGAVYKMYAVINVVLLVHLEAINSFLN
jgi:hypothetical protein